MIENGKNYKPADLKKIFGENWRYKLGLINVIYPQKPKISNFFEFDEETQSVYIKIYNILKEKNPDQNFDVWATGSRVKGYWRTKEEAEQIALKYNKKIKYSDYDFCTNAKNIPDINVLSSIIGEKVDISGCESHKVLVLPIL